MCFSSILVLWPKLEKIWRFRRSPFGENTGNSEKSNHGNLISDSPYSISKSFNHLPINRLWVNLCRFESNPQLEKDSAWGFSKAQAIKDGIRNNKTVRLDRVSLHWLWNRLVLGSQGNRKNDVVPGQECALWTPKCSIP